MCKCKTCDERSTTVPFAQRMSPRPLVQQAMTYQTSLSTILSNGFRRICEKAKSSRTLGSSCGRGSVKRAPYGRITSIYYVRRCNSSTLLLQVLSLGNLIHVDCRHRTILATELSLLQYYPTPPVPVSSADTVRAMDNTPIFSTCR